MGKERNYWLAIERYENWLADKNMNFKLRGFGGRAKGILNKVKIGDLMVVYIASKKSSVGAIIEVLSEVYIDRSNDLIWDDFFRVRVKTKPIIILDDKNLVLFKELVPNLSFITNEKNWGNFMRHSLKKISEEDFKVIETAIKKKIK